MTKNIGKLYINKAEITSIVKVGDTESQKVMSGEYTDYRNEGPFTTRYYLTTNALPIKKSENYTMLHLYGPEVHFAVSDNLSIGVMASWIASPIALATKYSFDSKSKNHLAVGTIAGSTGFLFNGNHFGGLHFATFTHGTRKANFSLSAGYGWTYLNEHRIWTTYGAEYAVRGEDYRYSLVNIAAVKKINGQEGGSDLLTKPFTGAGVFGVSSITPVGKKASFIFDGMAILAPRYKREVFQSFQVDDVTYQDYSGNTFVEDVILDQYNIVVSGIKPTVLIMPGMRFNQAHNKAFQVVLAGVITTDSDGDVFTFPIPMVSWLRTF